MRMSTRRSIEERQGFFRRWQCEMPDISMLARRLRSVYGAPERPPSANAFEYYLWDRVGYLFDDAKRLEAFEMLRREIGLRADAIYAAPIASLTRIAAIGGIEP